MALNIWGALKRAVTLPKSRNSLSDVLGETQAAYWRALAKQRAGDVVDHVIGFVGSGTYAITTLALQAANRLAEEVTRETGVAVPDRERKRMETLILDAVKGVEKERSKVEAALRAGIEKWLRL